jgi:hypothetical protein
VTARVKAVRGFEVVSDTVPASDTCCAPARALEDVYLEVVE